VILQILADARKMMNQWNAERAQFVAGAYSGEHQQLRGTKRAS
jgi:hypothetical protein